jgi:hypothetical protein
MGIFEFAEKDLVARNRETEKFSIYRKKSRLTNRHFKIFIVSLERDKIASFVVEFNNEKSGLKID